MSVEESLWSLRLANGDIRSGTLEQLQEAFRAGHVAGNSPVLPPGAREWVALDTIAVRGLPASVKPPAVVPVATSPRTASVRPSASPPPTASQPPQAQAAPNADTWQVRLPNGEVRSGTRQQLDEAFRAGHIDGSSPTLPAGAREWTRLDVVLQPPEAAIATPVIASASQVDEVCHVKIPRVQLEDAFRAGFLDESILVLTPDADDWVKLGSLVDRSVSPSITSRQAAVSQTGEWPPPETNAFAGDGPVSAPQTDPVLIAASTRDDQLAKATENENGLESAKLPDDDTPSMPGLT